MISISAVITLILIIIIVVLFIKCRKYSNQNGKLRFTAAATKTVSTTQDKFSDGAFTSSALYAHPHKAGLNKHSSQREISQLKNGGFEPRLSSSRGQSVESSYDQHNTSGGLLPFPQGHLAPQTHDTYSHLQISTGDGTLSRQPVSGTTTTLPRFTNGLSSMHELDNKQHLNGGINVNTNRISGTDSWFESSRSRETSPASSIPPGMPAFRVIPLCNGTGEQGFQDDLIDRPLQNDPFAHTIGATTFPTSTFGDMSNVPRGSSTLGSDVTSNPASDRFANYSTTMFAPVGAHSAGTIRANSETASNGGINWPLPQLGGDASQDNLLRGPGAGNSTSALNLNGTNSNASTTAPLLRRNQYWV